jgi:hypothetical protein
MAQIDKTLISRMIIAFDDAVEHLLSHDVVEGVPEVVIKAFHKSHASSAYRCRFPNCQILSLGFASEQLRTQHETSHFRRLHCKVDTCPWSRIGFEKKNLLDKHTRTYHSEQGAFIVPPRIRRSSEDTIVIKAPPASPEASPRAPSTPTPNPQPKQWHYKPDGSLEAPWPAPAQLQTVS